jgi:hypothetical protein
MAICSISAISFFAASIISLLLRPGHEGAGEAHQGDVLQLIPGEAEVLVARRYSSVTVVALISRLSVLRLSIRPSS